MLTTIDVPTPDGSADAYLAQPETGGTHPGVLLYMDAFGLRPGLADMAERIAVDGYVVLVPNVHYRSGRAPLVHLSDLSQPENREKMFAALHPIMSALTPELSMRDADAYVYFLNLQPSVAPGPIGVTGYCMGGALSLRTAAHLPDRVAAAASFHGGQLVTDAPDSPHLLAGQISAELFLAHADHDHSMPPEQIELLERALDTTGVRYRSETYTGAAHGFTMADTSAYDEAATQRHWVALLGLLDRQLKPATT